MVSKPCTIKICVFAALIFVSAISTSHALSIVSQWPTLNTWEHRTAWPASLVFSASLNTSTVTPSSFWVTREDTQATVAGTISFAKTNVNNDTVVFTPSQRWKIGVRYRFHVTSDVKSTGGDSFDGNFPNDGFFASNVSMDFERPEYDPLSPFDVFVNSNVLVGFDITDPESTDPNKPWTIPGMSATEAWKYTAGRPDVIVAIIDNGLDRYNNRELADHLFLNKGELPMPKDGEVDCPDWDCNGDGRFSASDYANDPRVPAPQAGYPLSPAELLEAFADDVDNDENGFADDISGWDFLRQRPEPIGIDEWQEGAHGEGRSKDACAIIDNNYGDKPGFCPNCTILAIRVSDAIMASHNVISYGVEYAKMMGAQVGIAASGTPDYSWQNEEAVLDAFDSGMILVAAAGDELGFHHSYPAAGEEVLSIKSIFPIPNVPIVNQFAFIETYCTNYNEHVHLAGSSGACSSEATGNVGGAAGLLISRALDLEIELTPNEVKQLLTMTADDIKNRCMTMTGGGCQEGFERHFGYGRPNLRNAMQALSDAENHKIPPEVRIISPRWWSVLDPTVSSQIPIEAYIYARGAQFTYAVEAARGHEPLDSEFTLIASGNGQEPMKGQLATLNLYQFFTDSEMRGPVTNPDQYTITVRVRAWREAGGGTVMGEDRKAFAAHADDDVATGYLPGLPFDLKASGESSPALYDLDGKDGGKLELIFGTTDGNVEVFGWDESQEKWARRSGFPVNIRAQGRRSKDLVLASPAVGDLFGIGLPIIVVVTGNGCIFALWPEGNEHKNELGEPDPFLPGFPYCAPLPDPSTPKSYGHGNTFAASPVLADLDGDGILEIIAANYDVHIYAIKPLDEDSDGVADNLPGFPVQALSLSGAVPPELICKDEDGNTPEGVQILSTPAVGVLDPNYPDPDVSQFPSILIATTEVCGSGLNKTGRFYAIHHDGYNNDSGSPFVRGFPLALPAPLSDALPIPPLTTGITGAPAMARWQDETLVGTGAFAYFPQVIKIKNGEIEIETLNAGVSIGICGHGAFGKLTQDGALHYALPTLSAIKVIEGWFSLLKPLVMAWDLSIWQKPVVWSDLEDIHFYISPIIADINGDGTNEVIAGSSGFILHAISPDGTEPYGWPKFTFNWHIATPAVGDANNDGLLEIFAPTHEGKLYGWKTTSPACVNDKLNAEWRKFHHDEYNSGVYGTDTLPPGVITDLKKEPTQDGRTLLKWTAPGSDWYCGTASYYEVRVGNDSDELATPEGFMSAEIVLNPPAPKPAGEPQEMTIADQPSKRAFAIRSVDENGHISHIAVTSAEHEGDDDEDEDEKPCGCGF